MDVGKKEGMAAHNICTQGTNPLSTLEYPSSHPSRKYTVLRTINRKICGLLSARDNEFHIYQHLRPMKGFLFFRHLTDAIENIRQTFFDNNSDRLQGLH